MRFHIVIRYIGLALLLNSLFMLFSIGISVYDGVDTGFFPLLMSFVLTAILGLFPMIFNVEREIINKKEGYAIVVGAWTLSCLVGILPFLLWGGEFSIMNAWFESVSGYTTTGATILSDVEALPRSLLFWRSSTHLIGGAGVVIFALALMPIMGQSRMTLSSVEMSAFAKETFNFKIQKAIRIILFVYIFNVLILLVLLKLAGMNWFDAVNHSFSTIATGGFSTKNASIAFYNSISIEVILIIFMLLSGTNFALIYSTITSRRNNIFRSEVARYYYGLTVVSIIVVTFNLWAENYYDFWHSLRLAAFQVSSLITTTGFATIDTGNWPALSVLIIIFLTYQCACAGSTGGGVKADRMVMLYKAFKAQFLQLQHPNAIIRIKFGNLKTNNTLIIATLLFILLYTATAIVGTLLGTAFGMDLTTAFTASVACISNSGPGFGEVSSLSNYANVPEAMKFIYSLIMLAGRMELFGFFQLFLFSSWK